MSDSMNKTSVYSEKLGENITVASGVSFSYPQSSDASQEWSNGYWNRDLGDYWNRSW